MRDFRFVCLINVLVPRLVNEVKVAGSNGWRGNKRKGKMKAAGWIKFGSVGLNNRWIIKYTIIEAWEWTFVRILISSNGYFIYRIKIDAMSVGTRPANKMKLRKKGNDSRRRSCSTNKFSRLVFFKKSWWLVTIPRFQPTFSVPTEAKINELGSSVAEGYTHVVWFVVTEQPLSLKWQFYSFDGEYLTPEVLMDIL